MTRTRNTPKIKSLDVASSRIVEAALTKNSRQPAEFASKLIVFQREGKPLPAILMARGDTMEIKWNVDLQINGKRCPIRFLRQLFKFTEDGSIEMFLLPLDKEKIFLNPDYMEWNGKKFVMMKQPSPVTGKTKLHGKN